MDPRMDEATVDWAALERRLRERACWYDDPRAYQQGVRDTLTALRQGIGDHPVARRVVAAG